MPILKTINEKFFEKWSSEMAYVLGFFIADGSLIINSRGAKYLDFHITDGILLKRIKKVLNSNHKIREEKGNPNCKRAYRLQIGSKKMFDDLLKLDVRPRKTGHEKLPDMPSKYFGDFLRGFFDGDGNVWKGYAHKNDRPNPTPVLMTCLTSKSKQFLISLKISLNKKLGLKGRINYHSRAHRLHFSILDSLKLYNFMYKRLGQANIKRDKQMVREIIELLRELNEGWKTIAC